MTSKTPQDIFGDTVRGGYGVDDDDEWVTVPVNLIPGKTENVRIQWEELHGISDREIHKYTKAKFSNIQKQNSQIYKSKSTIYVFVPEFTKYSNVYHFVINVGRRTWINVDRIGHTTKHMDGGLERQLIYTGVHRIGERTKLKLTTRIRQTTNPSKAITPTYM